MNLVVKLGGEVIAGPGAAREPGTSLGGIASDIKQLMDDGQRVTLVHGGGPQATELGRRLGMEPRLVGGRRVTDAATLDVVKMALGRLNVDLCAALRAAGARAVGLHDAIRAVRRPPRVVSGGGAEPVDLGLVGDVVGFDEELLGRLSAAGRVPVLACLGVGDGGAVYNINADVVATQLAAAIQADLLVLVTAVDGVRRSLADPASRIATLSVAEGRAAIAAGHVTGGMIPKLEESFAALSAGVPSILIVSGDLARAIAHPGSSGTIVTR